MDQMSSQVKYSDHIGGVYPYFKNNQLIQAYNSFPQLISSIPPRERVVDNAGVIEMLSKSYLLGERTLIKNVQRLPWMARISDQTNGFDFFSLPEHGNEVLEAAYIAKELTSLLLKETLNYISGLESIGILLSGGLDSRIVAGLVRQLQIEGKYLGKVTVLTWGIEGTRDVVYAERIARTFDWDFVHFNLNADTLCQNIEIVANIGCEVSPLHLHALPTIKTLKGIDAILAGSYGDSVGRGEFSGKRVLDLGPTLPRNLNQYGLIKHDELKKELGNINFDAYGYRERVSRESEYQFREIEQQMHYMRRKLQYCMSLVSENIPLYQLFTNPNIVKLMWSLNPKIRNDEIYTEILKTLPENIGTIPWSRTGKPLGEVNSIADKYPKQHHQYGKWLRQELSDYVIPLVTHDAIFDSGLFNNNSIISLIKIWRKSKTLSNNSLDELFSWLASFSLMIQQNSLQFDVDSKATLRDSANSKLGIIRAQIYVTAREMRRI